jgi:hypothetical protein
MRVARTGVAILGRQAQTRFDAACGPRPRGVLGRIAHFDAESVASRFRTAAIASTDRPCPELGGRIRPNHEGTAEEAQGQARGSYKPDRIWARPVPTRSTHCRIVQSLRQKTDRARSLKISLPGSCNAPRSTSPLSPTAKSGVSLEFCCGPACLNALCAHLGAGRA